MAELLFPYQETGAQFLVDHGRAGLFDVPGLGKTAQAIRALDLKGLERGLIVSPASVSDVWVSEIQKFSGSPRRLVRGRTKEDLERWQSFKHDIIICSYEMATKWRREFEKDFREFTIWDESHYLKSFKAQRTRSALGHQCDGKFGYGKWGGYSFLLSGTPMSNHPADIWTWLRYVQGTPLTYRQFVARYFVENATAFSSTFKLRKETLPELRSLIAKHSIRRTFDDVGLQLPKMWITTQEVNGDTEEIKALLAEHEGLDKAILEALEKGGLSFIDAGHGATLRRLVGEAKAPVFARQLVEEIEGGLDKIVVFCEHRKPVEILHEALEVAGIQHVIINGSTPQAARAGLVQHFQNDPDTKVFLGTSAAYEGITLTAAANVVMLEQNWTPAKNAQALKRVLRIGQNRPVHARMIALSKSIDVDVAESVARKTREIVSVQGNEI